MSKTRMYVSACCGFIVSVVLLISGSIILYNNRTHTENPLWIYCLVYLGHLVFYLFRMCMTWSLGIFLVPYLFGCSDNEDDEARVSAFQRCGKLWGCFDLLLLIAFFTVAIVIFNTPAPDSLYTFFFVLFVLESIALGAIVCLIFTVCCAAVVNPDILEDWKDSV